MRIVKIGRRRKSLCALKLDVSPDMLNVGDEIKRDRRFDESGYLLLDLQTITDAGIDENTVLSEEELLQLIGLSDYNRARSSALWRLSFRSFSQYEMVQKLSLDYGRSAAERAADRMVELGYINDETYAAHLADKYINIKKYAPRDAVYRITAKGIDRELAQAAVDETEPDISAQISELIEKKYAAYLGDEKGVRRTVSALARKGYAYGDIRSALDKYIDENDYEE